MTEEGCLSLCVMSDVAGHVRFDQSLSSSFRMAEVSQEERLQAIAVSPVCPALPFSLVNTRIQSAHQGTLMDVEAANHRCLSGSDRPS